MKKVILNLVINEVRKNKAFRVIIIKAIINYLNMNQEEASPEFKEKERDSFYHTIMLLEDICEYIDFDNLVFDIRNYFIDNDLEVNDKTLIEALTNIFNSIEE